MGKTHALTKGVEIAQGDYFLFTDADVHFSSDAISKAVAYCEEKNIDQLGMLPYIWTDKLLLNVTLLTFIRLFGLIATFWGICKPRTKAFTGVGAFNLVRRSAFEKTNGFEWLKLEITDDVALGMLIKQSGGQVSLVNGRSLIKVLWYPGIREMTVGLEKGAYAALGNFSFRRTLFWTIMFLGVEFSPLLAILTFGVPMLQLFGAASWLIALITSIRMSKWTHGPLIPAILFPLGTIIFSGMLMRAGWLGWRRDGVVWRGTYYSEDLLRSGKRFSLP